MTLVTAVVDGPLLRIFANCNAASARCHPAYTWNLYHFFARNASAWP